MGQTLTHHIPITSRLIWSDYGEIPICNTRTTSPHTITIRLLETPCGTKSQSSKSAKFKAWRVLRRGWSRKPWIFLEYSSMLIGINHSEGTRVEVSIIPKITFFLNDSHIRHQNSLKVIDISHWIFFFQIKTSFFDFRCNTVRLW